jgi:tetratricopeptide (TPR) repeat protein
MRQPVQTLLEHVRRGLGGVVLLGGAAPADLAVVAGPVVEGLCVLRAGGGGSPAADGDPVPPAAFGGLSELVRPLIDRGSGAGFDLDGEPGAGHLGAAAGELLVQAAARQPVLAVVTDAHLLDPESATAIAVAVRATGRAPVAWLIGLDDVRRSPFGALGAVGVQLQRPAGPVENLPKATAKALLVLAASGTGHIDEVGGALEHLGLRVGDLAPAVAGGVVEATASGWRFRDRGVATSIYATATPTERQETHAAFVDAIAEQRETERGEILARHLAGAATGPDGPAAEALGRAADGARLRGSLEAARSSYGRAANLSPDQGARARWLASAADTARQLGDLGGVGRAIREARVLTTDATLHHRLDRIAARTSALRTPQARLKILLESGSHTTAIGLILAGRAIDAEAMLAPVVSSALLSDPLDMGPLTLPAIAAGALWTSDARGASAVLDRSISLLRAYGAAEHLPALLIVRAEVAFRAGRWPAARDDAMEAAGLASRLGQQPVRSVARGLAMRISSLMGAPSEDVSVLKADSSGSEAYLLWARHAVGVALLAERKWSAAATVLAEVASALEALGVRDPSVLPLTGDLVEAQLRAGNTDGARVPAERAGDAAGASMSIVARAVAERCLGQVVDPEKAKPYFEKALRLHAETEDRYEEARTLLAYGRRTGDLAQFRAAADRFAALGSWPWLALAEKKAFPKRSRKKLNALTTKYA